MTGEQAVIKMQKERGHVVIGYAPQDYFPDVGGRVDTFAGAMLRQHYLEIIGETDRKDWEEQVAAIFGPKHRANKKHPSKPGEKFFSCTLVEDKA